MSDRPPPLDWENALRPEDIATVAALIENDGEEERSRQYHTHANKLSGNLRRSRHARLMQYDPLGTNASRGLYLVFEVVNRLLYTNLGYIEIVTIRMRRSITNNNF